MWLVANERRTGTMAPRRLSPPTMALAVLAVLGALNLQAGAAELPALTSEAQADQVSTLPGWGAVKGFRLFSG